MRIDRFSVIRQKLYAEGNCSIHELSLATGASAATIRRDLLALEAEGVVTRTHGGAQISDAVGVEVAFEHRESHNIEAKRAIAEAAYQRLVPHMAVFLDAGTTVLQLARRIRMNPLPLTVFTNCLTVAQVLMDVPGVKLMLLGGALRSENASLVGGMATEMLERLWFDRLFLGAGAFGADGYIYSLDEDEARANTKMVERSEATTLMIDSSKFGKRLTYRVAHVGDGMEVIADEGLAPEWQASLETAGAHLAMVPCGGAGPGAES